MSLGGRREWLLAALLAAVLAVAVVALVIGLSDDDDSDRSSVASTSAFVDSVGVNTHVTYYDTSYGRFDDWARRLRELGVRHVRDGLVLDPGLPTQRLRKLADQGQKLTLITALDKQPAAEQVAFAKQFGPALDAIEGPNEPDVLGPKDWEPKLRRFAPALVDAAKAAGMRTVYAPSLVQHASRSRVRDANSEWGIPNIHPYPGGREPTVTLKDEVEIAGGNDESRFVVTEDGYHTALDSTSTDEQPPVSEQAMATYVPRLLLETFAAGARRTFLYELLDERPEPGLRQPEQHFGLLRQDMSTKPAFEALKTMLALMRDARVGKGAKSTPSADVSGGSDLRSLPLRRPDGSRVLALWRAVSVWDSKARRPQTIQPTQARVRFAGTARDVVIHQPTKGTKPLSERSQAESLVVPLTGDVVLVSYR